ncbi:hypothetical protein NI389_18310 (plasmid) [Pseudoalteromonas xiamenensis]|uniref:hypothetical protein n=1 Tax=Pseudoalteromonas xiamenensis TaxID=882626 RepID=UPI0027E47D88|nr:hypothetical protein [Pseudoalteromonas xiamenensis]WMN61764.1 hypothetical protein NI389_18310 [Pseudoalteromonas xiamenensis]
MLVSIVLVSIWVLLMFRSGVAEYKYYQAVKTLEPKVWEQLGSPKYFKIPIVFVSPKGSKLLRGISNEIVCEFANKHRQAGILFLAYVAFVLVASIVYFKIA